MRIERSKVLELSDVRNQKILDIGAGYLAVIAARDFNCRVTSIDISQSVLRDENERIIREGLEDKINLIEMDASNLSFDDDEFSVIISYGALHHNPPEKRRKILEEIKRVCRNKISIMEFKKEYHPHPEDVHEAIDHDWLETVLNSFGETDKYIGEEKILYICRL